MTILEKIAANILFFLKKMSLTDKEKLKIAVEAHYKLHKRKGKSHTFTTYKNGGVNRATIYRWLPGSSENRCFFKVTRCVTFPYLHKVTSSVTVTSRRLVTHYVPVFVPLPSVVKKFQSFLLLKAICFHSRAVDTPGPSYQAFKTINNVIDSRNIFTARMPQLDAEKQKENSHGGISFKDLKSLQSRAPSHIDGQIASDQWL